MRRAHALCQELGGSDEVRLVRGHHFPHPLFQGHPWAGSGSVLARRQLGSDFPGLFTEASARSPFGL